MNTIIFICHSETDIAGRFCGHSDPELNLAAFPNDAADRTIVVTEHPSDCEVLA
jgi:hypothetical protein